ncbi:MAG: hypothetical protein IT305_12965 [Chloroflexi bacterium]|nr:hypothetical protein [Chloroflexota bacterium]
MKQTSSFPRRTALAIAAASAGLTLAVTATIASSLGLIAPAAPVAAPSTVQEQPLQQPSVPTVNEGLAFIPADLVGQPATAEATRQTATIEDVRSTRREHDHDDDRGEKLRRSSPSDAAAERSVRQLVSRAHHEEDDND